MNTIGRARAFWLAVGLFAWCELSTAALAGDGTNLFTKIAAWRSTNNVAAVVQSLPDIEKLWPQEPEMYVRCIMAATSCLAMAPETNEPATQFLFVVLANLVKTNYPSDPAIAANCIELQYAAIQSLLNIEPMRHNKLCLIAEAQFLGQIRSLRIPNYTMRGAAVPPGAREIFMREHVPPSYDRLTNAADRQEYDQLAAENEKGRPMDMLQSVLSSVDNRTKSYLLSDCSYFPTGNPTDADLIREIAADAHLTEAERRQLHFK